MPNALKKLAEFLGSIRLAITLLIVLTVVSFFGIVIPQDLSSIKYIGKLGPIPGKMLLLVGYDHVFSTYWFYLLMGLFSCNILVCSATRLWKNTKNSLKKSFLPSRGAIAQFKNSSQYATKADCESVKTSIVKQLKGQLYLVKVRQNPDGYQIAARKGILKDFGSLLFHLSIIILFIGGLVGARLGYSVFKELKSGDVTGIPDRSFLLRCDWFKLEQNEEGQIKSYKTKVTVLSRDSVPVFEKIIEVNKPLSYQGIRVYQSSYNQDPHEITDVLLSVHGPDLPPMGFVGSVPYDSLIQVPQTAMRLRVSDYIPDFFIDMETRQVSSRSDDPNNPAVKVVLTRGNDTLYNHWTFFNYPDQHAEGEKYRVLTSSYTPVIATGLQFRKNPGIPLIFTGIFAMTFGIFAVFYISRRSIWVFLGKSEKNGTDVSVGGSSNSAPAAFESEFNKLVSSLKSRTGSIS